MKTFKRKHIILIAAILIIAAAMGTMFPKSEAAAKKKKILVAYFSVTGTTKSAAKKVKKATGATLYRIKPETPYTDDDIDYSKDNIRAEREQDDDDARPAIKGKVKKMSKYDVIFVGYPIWFSKEPKVIRTFLESYNLKGKTVIPFCTSGGSGISGSIKEVTESAKDAEVLKGKDLTDMASKKVKKWVKKVLK